jgi:hypothetical protein
MVIIDRHERDMMICQQACLVDISSLLRQQLFPIRTSIWTRSPDSPTHTPIAHRGWL